MRRHAFKTASLVACLVFLTLAPAAAQDVRPIEGHENWKLGMSMAEALAAEPRAERRDCGDATCLHYADRRFASAEIAVSAHFDAAADALDVIVITMAVKPGDNRCQRLYAQLAAFYTAAHGETLPVSQDAWIWSQPEATLTLLNRCRSDEQKTINILFESLVAHGG